MRTKRLLFGVALCWVVVVGCSADVHAPATTTSTTSDPIAATLRGLAQGDAAMARRLSGTARTTGHAARPLVTGIGATADAAWELREPAAASAQWSLRPLDHAAVSATTVEAGRSTYRDVAPSTDLIIARGDDWSELAWVLRDAAAPTTHTLAVTHDPSLHLRTGAKGLSLVDASGRTRLHMPPPIAIDAAGTRRAAHWIMRDDRLEITIDTRGLSHPIVLDPYVGTTTWLEQEVTPSGRASPFMTEIPGKLVVFGGSDATSIDDTWIWDGTRWSAPTSSTEPPIRDGAGMATANGHAIYFGGDVIPSGSENGGAATFNNDTWSFDGSTWTQLAPAHQPSPRSDFSIGTVGDHTIVYGGSDGSGNEDDTWSFDGTDWTQLSNGGGPSIGGSAFIVSDGGTPLMTDGFSTWRFSGGAWNETTVGATSPCPAGAFGLAGVATTTSGVTAVCVSYADGSLTTSTWSSAGWSAPVTTTTVPSRFAFSVASFGADVALFGGRGALIALADLWTFDGTTWSEPIDHSAPPAYSTSLLGAYDGAAVLVGGALGSSSVETWEWNGTGWRDVAAGGPPSVGDCVGDGGNAELMVVLSQLGGGTAQTWGWDHKQWTQLDAAAPVSPSSACAIARTSDTTVMVDANGFSWTWSGNSWTAIAGAAPAGAGPMFAIGDTIGYVVFNYQSARMLSQWSWTKEAGWVRADGTGLDLLVTNQGAGVGVGRFGVVFGDDIVLGHDVNAAWLWDGVSWGELAVSGVSQQLIGGVSAFGGSALLVGAAATGATVSTTYALDLTLEEGSSCAGATECRSGFCASGVCCNAACDGPLATCNAIGTVGTCTTKTAACTGPATLTTADGTTKDCAPYLCLAGACLQQCATTDDCNGGSVCDTSSALCVAPSTAASSGGCTFEGATRTRSPVSTFALGLTLAAIATRRRRRR